MASLTRSALSKISPDSILLLWALMSGRDRLFALVFGLLQFLCSFLEVVGIGLIIPAVALLSESPSDQPSQIVSWIREVTGVESQGRLALITITVLCLLLLVKAVTIGILAVVQGKFVFGLQERLSGRLFDTYLMQPWSAHLHRNSADLIRNCTSEVTQVLGVLLALIGSAGDMLLIAGLVFVMLWSAPLGAGVVTAVVIVPVGIYFVVIRHKLARWGRRRLEAEGRRMGVIQQGLTALKELKVRGKERRMSEAYQEPNREAAAVGKWYYLVSQLPRVGLESLAMLGIVGWMLLTMALGQPANEVVASVILVVAVSVRMIPAVQRVIAAAQVVRFGSSSIALISGELATSIIEPGIDSEVLSSPVREIRLSQLSFRHVGASREVLRDVELVLPIGSAVGIVGASGVGKSTLGDLLMGLLRPTAGNVELDSHLLERVERQWRSRIGYVPQSVAILDDTIRRNVALGCRDDEIDEDRIWRVLDAAHVGADVRGMSDGLDAFAGESGARLSGGQRQRLGIARALYMEPEVIVLDEATSALDADTEAQFINTLAELKGKVTIIVITHRSAPLRVCDRVYEIRGADIRLVEKAAASS
jgi:ABC-type bacteriocin/lantibiotic exporter with double-glycine peptidase domain